MDSILLGLGPLVVLHYLTANGETLILLGGLWTLFLFLVFESTAGQTPGKRVTGIRVVKTDGGRPGVGAVALRTILRLVDCLPSTYLVGMVTMLINGERRQRLGDIAAGTVVAVAAPGGGAEMVRPAAAASPELPGAAFESGKPRRPVRDLVVAGVGCVLILAIGGSVISSAFSTSPEDAVRERALAFVDAREAGDGPRACDQLTPDAQRDMVARVEGLNVEDADPADCPEHIVTASPRSDFTRQDFGRFRAGSELVVTRYVGDGAGVAPVDDPYTSLEAVKVGDRWLLDGLGAERGSFIQGCHSSGQEKALCECLFEHFRDSGQQGAPEIRALARQLASTGSSPELGRAAEACAASV